MVTKVLLYNIALQALRLNYQTTDPDNDVNKSVKTLRTFYPLAISSALADMDLNKTAKKIKLEELNLEHPHWTKIYKYPSNCAKFRRIVSPFRTDNKETRIPFATEVIGIFDVVATHEPEAYGEIIPTDVNLSVLSPSAALAVGFQMAVLATGLIVGKGAVTLKESIIREYTLHKATAQENDMNENVDTTPDEFKSEFVNARLGGSRWRSRI